MTVEEKIDAVLALVTSIDRKLASKAAASPGPALEAAPDHELDKDYANFVVEKMPTRWKGDDFTGSRLSETSAEFCRAVAGLKKWKGDKERSEGKTYTNKKGEKQNSCDYSYKQAAWAMGWALRLENGHRPAEEQVAAPADDSSIPF